MSDIEFVRDELNKLPVDPPPRYISEYIEGRRILPPSTPFPGFVDLSRTPYLIEIIDNMSPYSPVQEQDIMKGAQIGVTFAAENVIAYYMGPYPSEILFISATDRLLEKWATKRLEPLIDSCGLRERIFSQVQNSKTRRSGDKIYSKEFVGGTLDMASAQSASSLRSDSKRVLILDEIDGAPAQLKTGEGNFVAVADARTLAWGHRAKKMRFSTPTTYDASLIKLGYDSGDRRKFFVACPLCGKRQILIFDQLRGETKAGELDQVYYLCEFCNDALFDNHKGVLLKSGKWEPTAEFTSLEHPSYHISSLYSPPGMLSWRRMWQKYQEALEDPEGMRWFTNLYLGKPFRETGSRPKLDKVIELRGGYKSGTVPHGVIYLTAGIDVQRGSATDPSNPPRLEMEVLGHGERFRTWSIAYFTFHGATDDAYSGAWEKLMDFAMDGGLVFRRPDGKKFLIQLILIDSGDGQTYDTVYNFCKGWQRTYPSKGTQALKRKKGEKSDEIGPDNFKRYRVTKVDEDTYLYTISTNYYKAKLYNNLKITRQDGKKFQKPGFCDFPVDYGDKYFKGLTAEEKRRDGSFYCPSGRRNEPLDCRVMATCAGDIHLDAIVGDIKDTMKRKGATALQLQQITHKTVLKKLARDVGFP